MNSLKYFVLLAVVVLSTAGCTRQYQPDGFPPLFPTSIKVVQDGKPLVGAEVYLYRKDDVAQKWGIIGDTDEDGKAVFYTHGKFSGVPEGNYCVTVEKKENITAPRKKGSNADATDTYSLVETQYIDRGKTPLQLSVRKKGSNFEQFDVGRSVRVFVERWM